MNNITTTTDNIAFQYERYESEVNRLISYLEEFKIQRTNLEKDGIIYKFNTHNEPQVVYSAFKEYVYELTNPFTKSNNIIIKGSGFENKSYEELAKELFIDASLNEDNLSKAVEYTKELDKEHFLMFYYDLNFKELLPHNYQDKMSSMSHLLSALKKCKRDSTHSGESYQFHHLVTKTVLAGGERNTSFHQWNDALINEVQNLKQSLGCPNSKKMEILILTTIIASIRVLLTNTLDEEGFRHFINELFLNNDLKQIFSEKNFENTLFEVIEKKDNIRSSILVDRKRPGLYLNEFGNKRKSFKNRKKYNKP